VRSLKSDQATPCSVSQALDIAMVEARQGYRAPVVFGSQSAATSAETAQEEPTVYVDEEKLKARYIAASQVAAKDYFSCLRHLLVAEQQGSVQIFKQFLKNRQHSLPQKLRLSNKTSITGWIFSVRCEPLAL